MKTNHEGRLDATAHIGEMALARRRVALQLQRVVALTEAGRYTADAELLLMEVEGALAHLMAVESAAKKPVESSIAGLEVAFLDEMTSIPLHSGAPRARSGARHGAHGSAPHRMIVRSVSV